MDIGERVSIALSFSNIIILCCANYYQFFATSSHSSNDKQGVELQNQFTKFLSSSSMNTSYPLIHDGKTMGTS